MIRVMVVEDEPLILRSIKQMIEETNNNFKVVAEAYDGEEALQIIEDTNPDIIFTDIKMPVMDGLTLIEELQKKKIVILPILLSGYQEFEYAKKAIKIGVVEYLLKPLSPNALECLLKSIYNRFEQTKKEYQLNFLNNIIQNKFIKSENYPQNIKFFDYQDFSYILICAGSYCISPSKWLSPSKEFWLNYCLDDILIKYFDCNEQYWIFDGEGGNEKLVILASNKRISDRVKSITEQIYEELTNKEYPITFVVGYTTSQIFDLSFLIQQSRIILNKNIIFGKSQIILADNLRTTLVNLDNSIDSNVDKILSVYIQKDQNDLFKFELQNLLKVAQNKFYSQIRLERLLKHLINTLTDSIVLISESVLSDIDMEIDELISNSSNYNSILEGMFFIIDDIFQIKKLKHDDENDLKALTDRIEQYIISNYTRQLTLQSLSESFGLVPPYLSRIFKKYKGLSPSNYIVKLKIEKAKELLLKNQSMLLKDIAEAVGYDDPFYFSRVFKLMIGCSPTEFRMRVTS